MRIALIGNPNSGKTAIYNELTGQNEKSGNWSGVTVEAKEHRVKKYFTDGDKTVIAVDLPGAYSLSPFTSEESVTSDYIKNKNPDVIINIVDASNLSRSLFLTTQISELGIPFVVALNKIDINIKKHIFIDADKLSLKLGCPVISTVSTDSGKLKKLIRASEDLACKKQSVPYNSGSAHHGKKQPVKDDYTRFELVNSIVSQVEGRGIKADDKSTDNKIDLLLTSKWLGIPVFAAVMFLVFQISQVWVGAPVAKAFTGGLRVLQAVVGKPVTSDLLYTILIDGIIGGLVVVVGFLPIVMIMYFLLALLDDCGYMSRAAVLFDPVFKRVGLSGKSIIPFVMSAGCAVPGIMASRTIRNEHERRATAMLAPFIPCGAKIPVISLFTGAFFKNAGLVSAVCYICSIVLIFLGALLVNKITGYKARKSYFIIELPEYRAPSASGALKSAYGRGRAYIIKATTIILLCNTAIRIMQTFTLNFTVANKTASDSVLEFVSRPFAYALLPIIGVFSWQLAAAAITGLVAKENIVGTLAMCLSITNFVDTENLSQLSGGNISAAVGISDAAALAYLMLNLYGPPCFAAIGAMKTEIKSARWFWGGIGLQAVIAYTVAFTVYQTGTFVKTGKFGKAFVVGLTAVICAWCLISVAVIYNRKRRTKKQNFQSNTKSNYKQKIIMNQIK